MQKHDNPKKNCRSRLVWGGGCPWLPEMVASPPSREYRKQLTQRIFCFKLSVALDKGM
jgi:hypothetical protein